MQAEPVAFEAVAAEGSQAEVSRLFSAMLQLINNCNIQILPGQAQQPFQLKLLNTSLLHRQFMEGPVATQLSHEVTTQLLLLYCFCMTNTKLHFMCMFCLCWQMSDASICHYQGRSACDYLVNNKSEVAQAATNVSWYATQWMHVTATIVTAGMSCPTSNVDCPCTCRFLQNIYSSLSLTTACIKSRSERHHAMLLAGTQVAPKGGAPMQDLSNVDLPRPLKAAKQRKTKAWKSQCADHLSLSYCCAQSEWHISVVWCSVILHKPLPTYHLSRMSCQWPLGGWYCNTYWAFVSLLKHALHHSLLSGYELKPILNKLHCISLDNSAQGKRITISCQCLLHIRGSNNDHHAHSHVESSIHLWCCYVSRLQTKQLQFRRTPVWGSCASETSHVQSVAKLRTEDSSTSSHVSWLWCVWSITSSNTTDLLKPLEQWRPFPCIGLDFACEAFWHYPWQILSKTSTSDVNNPLPKYTLSS